MKSQFESLLIICACILFVGCGKIADKTNTNSNVSPMASPSLDGSWSSKCFATQTSVGSFFLISNAKFTQNQVESENIEFSDNLCTIPTGRIDRTLGFLEYGSTDSNTGLTELTMRSVVANLVANVSSVEQSNSTSYARTDVNTLYTVFSRNGDELVFGKTDSSGNDGSSSAKRHRILNTSNVITRK